MIKRYKRANGEYAVIGRYTRLMSPLFGKYYIDWRRRTGESYNAGVPESFETLDDAINYLHNFSFTEIPNR